MDIMLTDMRAVIIVPFRTVRSINLSMRAATPVVAMAVATVAIAIVILCSPPRRCTRPSACFMGTSLAFAILSELAGDVPGRRRHLSARCPRRRPRCTATAGRRAS